MKIILNPSEDTVMCVREALSETGGYCPCSIIRSEDTKCMCKEFREQKHVGKCHCGLYIKVEDV